MQYKIAVLDSQNKVEDSEMNVYNLTSYSVAIVTKILSFKKIQRRLA